MLYLFFEIRDVPGILYTRQSGTFRPLFFRYHHHSPNPHHHHPGHHTATVTTHVHAVRSPSTAVYCCTRYVVVPRGTVRGCSSRQARASEMCAGGKTESGKKLRNASWPWHQHHHHRHEKHGATVLHHDVNTSPQSHHDASPIYTVMAST